METLHLNLTKKWFDMILGGIKKEEYRTLSYFWATRFFDLSKSKNCKNDIKDDFEETPVSAAVDLTRQDIFKTFSSVTFSNGMKPIDKLRRFEIEFLDMRISYGNKDWGAKENELYFCIKLGKIISRKNC